MAAPPKKPKKEREQAEVVSPKSPKEMAEDFMPDMLKSLNQARSHAIKLTNVTYGKDLAKNLLDFAVGMEELYKSMQGALDTGDTSKLLALFEKAKKMEESEGGKAKAGIFDLVAHVPNMVTSSVFKSNVPNMVFLSNGFTFHLQLRSCTSEGSSIGASEEACKEKG